MSQHEYSVGLASARTPEEILVLAKDYMNKKMRESQMPIHVEIKINDTLINQIHIARVRGGTASDDVNDYVALEGDRPTRLEDWHIDSVPFKHRYGDSAEVCVAKAIQALGYVAKQQTQHPPQTFRDKSNGE